MPDPCVTVRTGCPSCGDLAEPEVEDGVFKYVCGCGYEFGFSRLEQPEDACSLGIPEDVRRGGVLPPETGGTRDQPPVFLTLGKRPQ
jgi:hypothetical protein